MTLLSRLVSLACRLFPAPSNGRLIRPPIGVAEHVIERIDLGPEDGGPMWYVWLVRWQFVRSFDTLAEAREAYPEAEVAGTKEDGRGKTIGR